MKNNKKHIEKAKDYIACAIEELREFVLDDPIGKNNKSDNIETIIIDLEDIQMLRL